MITAFEDNTYIDFPSGRVDIPRFQSCVFRGDAVHRGMANCLQIANHRGFFSFDSLTSRQFRFNRDGESTFEPVPQEEQGEYERKFLSNMPSAAAKTPVTSKRRKRKKLENWSNK
jgi:hypothetical protein